jgi:hypothetical protein
MQLVFRDGLEPLVPGIDVEVIAWVVAHVGSASESRFARGTRRRGQVIVGDLDQHRAGYRACFASRSIAGDAEY